ncbi:MAG: hypothetical protein ACKO0V_14770, partial [bacterium]
MTKPLQSLLAAIHTLRFSLLIGLLVFSISASGLKAADAKDPAGLDTQLKLAGDAAADWQK